MRRLDRAFVVGAALFSACGSPVPDTAPAVSAPPTSLVGDCAPVAFELVDADEVEISGDLDQQKRAMVEWVLDRFRPGWSAAACSDPYRL